MLIEGSCHCRIVTYRVESDTPYPFSHCHCSICRKLAGGSGSAVNIMANRNSLEVKGAEHLKIYRSSLNDRGFMTPTDWVSHADISAKIVGV